MMTPQATLFKAARMHRRSAKYREFQRTIHWERTQLDRHTATQLLSCFGTLSVLARWTVDDLLARWDEEQQRWQREVEPDARRPFVIGDFVTCLLCLQEKADGRKLHQGSERCEDGMILRMLQEDLEERMNCLEQDLQAAGFLAATTEQMNRRNQHCHASPPHSQKIPAGLPI